MIKKLIHLSLGAALAVALTTSTRAGSAAWNFNNWYDGTSTNLIFAGDDTTITELSYQQWFYGSGSGDPFTNGFLQLTPALDGRNLAVVFPDIDNGAPVKAFKLTMDVRAGNGDEHAADGFSISYVRESDVALSNVTVYVNPSTGRGIIWGFAGGDDLATAQSPAGANLPENGCKSGVAVAFDCWAGNWLPDTSDNRDREGIAVRVDDKTLTQVPMTEWNGGCDNTNSLQTGPWANNGGATYDGLGWCKLEVEKTVDNKVNVTWKGRKVLNGYQLAAYSVHKGRLILAGRTGGNNQWVHFDNITLETVPGIEPLVKSMTINPDLKGWTFLLEDTLPSALTNVTKVLWNGTNVTSAITFSKAGLISSITYTQATRLPALSANAVEVTFETSLAQTLMGATTATVMDYYVMPTMLAMPASAVSGQPRGIASGTVIQTMAGNPNTLRWTEEQLLGLHGTNLITTAPPAFWDVMDYQNDGGVGTANGNFRVGGSTAGFWEGKDYAISDLGFGVNPAKANTDAGTIEWFAYVNFPAAGDYYMIVNSDDGFRLTTARNSMDRMGQVVSRYEGGRGNGTGLGAGTSQRVIVEQAGVYPIRGFIENGDGGFNVEWYTRSDTNLFLVNSTVTGALQAYQTATGAGCYVKSAIPVRNATDVKATQKLMIELANGSTTVNAGSVVLKLDGAAVTPTVTSGTTIKLELSPTGPGGLWASNSVHTVELTFADSASTAYSYTWNFTAAPYSVLTGAAPLGSQDTAKVGFMYSTRQVDRAGTTGMPNRIYVAEQLLQGGWGTNSATLASGPVSGVINFNVEANTQGNFTANNGYPDGLVPGIPGLSALPNDDFACEILTYVEFPAAGFYTLGFNSDDGFWTRQGHAKPKVGQLTILTPPALAGNKGALLPSGNAGLEVLTTNDISGEIVLTSPINADTALNNAAQVAGKIALCYRGINSFADKIQKCAAAGAIAVIVVQSRPDVNPAEGVNPIEMGSTAGPVPSVMVHLATGNAITNALATGSVTGTLNAMINLNSSLGYFNDGRGASDTTYNVMVTAPGLYPLRTVWWQGGGGGNCEWFSYNAALDVRALLNDLTNPSALKTWYGVNYVPPPTVTVGKVGANIVITYTGTLQSAATVNGTYADVAGATSPYSTPATGGPMFFRARQ